MHVGMAIPQGYENGVEVLILHVHHHPKESLDIRFKHQHAACYYMISLSLSLC